MTSLVKSSVTRDSAVGTKVVGGRERKISRGTEGTNGTTRRWVIFEKFPGLNGFRGSMVSGVKWFPGLNGFRGSMVSGVKCFPGLNGFRGSMVSGVKWFPGLNG